MRNLKGKIQLLAILTVLLNFNTASAQSVPPKGHQTNGQTEPLDLPIMPPPPIDESLIPESDDDDGDDPRDTPPPVIYGEEIDTEFDTIVYVVDVSGSMRWGLGSYTTIDGNQATGTRLDKAKVELIRSITGLADNFKFNIVAFHCWTTQWSSELQEANPPNRSSATRWIFRLIPMGGTGTGPATALGLSEQENMTIILLTDGGPNCGASGFTGHRTMISNANTQGARINVFGIAAVGTYRSFCQAVASDSGGSYFDVP